jgi:hypothetical protein
MLLAALLQVAAEPPVPRLAPLEHITRTPCAAAPDGEVVVCGGRTDRYRLPFPVERDPPSVAGPSAGGGSGTAAITSPGRCGLFAGERRCGKREAADYGYGEGRDPISQLGKLADRLTGD